MKRILGAGIGDCIHVAGVLNFLELARSTGFDTIFLGSAISIDSVIEAIKENDPEVVAISYRLSPETCARLLDEFKSRISLEGLLDRDYLFGGTAVTAKVARETGIFKKVFEGTEPIAEIISFLRGALYQDAECMEHPDNLLDRIQYKAPFPLIRHHFGLPTVEETIRGSAEIAEAGVLDVLSIGPDQTAQECFFRPEEQECRSEGAGGVPLRTESDLRSIYEASRRGNYPLVRCYSGTADVLKWAELLQRTIKNAWCAVPLSWYNQMDKRGPRPLLQSIQEAQQSMKWHADRGIPVEVNEAHQWSLRRAPDNIAVTMAFLAAYNAKKMGVKHYVAQYMLNTPGQISPIMDLAKMLAKIEMIESLHDESFQSHREVRPGLLSFPADLDLAKGQMSMSIVLGLMLKPQIVHVVGYCEGQYAATTKEIIESCKIADQIIRVYLKGFPDSLTLDSELQRQKEKLMGEAKMLLDAIRELGEKEEAGASSSTPNDAEDALCEPKVLEKAIKIGLIDAPDLKGSDVAKGSIETSIIDGACVTIDKDSGNPLPEKERIRQIMDFSLH